MLAFSRRQLVYGVMMVVWTLGLALLFCRPVLTRLNTFGIWDWDEAAAHYEAARNTVFYYGQFPLWNPYMCGGAPALANPQSYYLSPVWLFALLFGSLPGPKIAAVFYLWAGMVGAMMLARWFGASRRASFIAAPLFLLNGFMAVHLAGGQFLWLTMAWVPWIVWFYLKSKDNWRFVIPAALLLALTGWAGRSYLVAYEALFLLLYGVISDVLERRRGSHTGRAALLLGLAFGLGAWKFIPDILFLRHLHQSLVAPFNDPSIFWKVSRLLVRDLSVRGNVNAVPLIEFGWYVGVVPLGLALLGLVWSGWRKSYIALTIVGLCFAFLTIMPDRFNVLEHVPILRELRNSQRMISIVLLLISVGVAIGIDKFILLLRLRRQLSISLLVIGVTAYVTTDLLLVSTPVLSQAYNVYYDSREPAQLPEPRFPFRQSDGFKPFPTVHENEGASQFCPAPLQVWQPTENGIGRTHVVTYRDEQYRGEAYTGGQGKVSNFVFTPNRLSFVFSSVVPDTVVVNQNWSEGWSASVGVVQPTENKLLAVQLSAGYYPVELRYYPPGLTIGLIISFLTLLAILSFLSWSKRWARIHSDTSQ